MKIKIQEKQIITAIFLSTFILYALLSNHCLWVDESRDLAVARNIATGNGITHWKGIPFTQHPFLYHILLAIIYLSIGNSIYISTLLTALFGAILTTATYYLGKELYDQRIGIASTIITATSQLILTNSTRILLDIPFTAILLISIYFFIKYQKTRKGSYLTMCAITTATSGLIKIPGLFILPIYITILILTAIKEKNITPILRAALVITIITTLLTPWMIHNQNTIGDPLNLKETIGWGTEKTGEIDVIQDITYYLKILPKALSTPIAILLLLSPLFLLTTKSQTKENILLTATILTYLTIFSIASVKVPRYLIPIIPLLIILAIRTYDKITQDALRLIKQPTEQQKKQITITLLTLLILLITTMTLPISINQNQQSASSFCGLKETGQKINYITQPNDTIWSGSYILMHYYADRENIKPLPKTKELFMQKINTEPPALIEIDAWERTQPDYIFEITETDLLIPIYIQTDKQQQYAIAGLYTINASSTNIEN